MREIPLTQGKIALVSDHRFKELFQYTWHAKVDDGKWYAERNVRGMRGRVIKMHRQIAGATDPKVLVDHRDGDGLNNQDENLRVCNSTGNARNASKRSDNTSGYKGVTLNKWGNKYEAKIRVNGKLIHLGTFSSPIDAAHAYDAAAKEHHGDFASLNFSQER
jgi:hypothetical protein